MSIYDATNYVLFNNPVSSTLLTGLSSLTKAVGLRSNTSTGKSVAVQVEMCKPLWKLSGRNLYFVRLAGLSGASAVILGAYGAHKPFKTSEEVDLRKVFETANRFHFFHSIALMAVPLSRRPAISGTLILFGMTLFCFPCYYRAFTGDAKFNKIAPIGGMFLILSWASLLL